MTSRLTRTVLALVALAAASACTVKKTEPPPTSGPSELGTALTLQALPDTLPQDGSSQSEIVVLARDANGQPVRSLPVRIDITVNGAIQDFGQLSARNVATGSDGRTSVVYTAPKSADTVDHDTVVMLLVTPVGYDAANQVARTVKIRLTPPGVITPPAGTAPDFTMDPADPQTLEDVTFVAALDRDVLKYSWSFGDGATATGQTVTHQYDDVGSFTVTLTAVMSDGTVTTRAKSITVKASDAPVPAFTFSPTDPKRNEIVFFNASESTATPPRFITAVSWDFGDGTKGTGKLTSHVYGKTATFTVTCTVRDDDNRTASTSKTIDIK